MKRKEHLNELWVQIAELKESFQLLGLKLIKEGEGIRDLGYLPDLTLLDELAAATTGFERLTHKLKQMAEALSLPWDDGPVDNFSQLESIWQRLHEQLEKILLVEQQNREAVALLERVLEAELPGGQRPAELEAFHREARKWVEMLTLDPMGEEAEQLRSQLLSGEHPLAVFLELVEEEDMALQEVAEHFRRVETAFGTLLAVAAIRKNVLFPSRTAEGIGLTTNAVEQQNAISPDEVFEEMEWREPTRRGQIPHIICEFIQEGKLNSAYYLACYAEQKHGKCPIPSWLIKALDLAGIVRGERGPAARLITDLFRDHHFLKLTETVQSLQLPYTLLVFASTLRPAVLIPSSNARAVLQNLSGLPPILDTICEKIGSLDDEALFQIAEKANTNEILVSPYEVNHQGVGNNKNDEREWFLNALQVAGSELDNMIRHFDKEDFFAAAGLAAAKRALVSLEQFLLQQQGSEENLSALALEQKELKEHFHINSENLKQFGPMAIECLGKAILEDHAKRAKAKDTHNGQNENNMFIHRDESTSWEADELDNYSKANDEESVEPGHNEEHN